MTWDVGLKAAFRKLFAEEEECVPRILAGTGGGAGISMRGTSSMSKRQASSRWLWRRKGQLLRLLLMLLLLLLLQLAIAGWGIPGNAVGCWGWHMQARSVQLTATTPLRFKRTPSRPH
jgi:hypothetical protein